MISWVGSGQVGSGWDEIFSVVHHDTLFCIEVFCVVSCLSFISFKTSDNSKYLITISYHSPTELRKIGKGVVLGAISLVGHSADGFIGQ